MSADEFACLADDPLDKRVHRGDVVDEALRHSGCPDPGIHVARLIDTSSPRSGDEVADVVETSAVHQDRDDLTTDGVARHSSSVPQTSKDELGLGRRRVDDGLFD